MFKKELVYNYSLNTILISLNKTVFLLTLKFVHLSSDKTKFSCYSTSQYSSFTESPTHSLSEVTADAVSARESGLTLSFSREEHISLPAAAGVTQIHTPRGNRSFVSHLCFPLWLTLGLDLPHTLFLFLLLSGLLLLHLRSYLFFRQCLRQQQYRKDGGARNHSNRFLFYYFHSE